jgi:hypothetical protein
LAFLICSMRSLNASSALVMPSRAMRPSPIESEPIMRSVFTPCCSNCASSAIDDSRSKPMPRSAAPYL